MTEPGSINAIGFIGLGNMGAPMTERLVAAGYSVQAYDVVPEARVHAVEAGASEATDLAGAVRGAELVILMLPNSQIVKSVVEDPAFLEAIAPGTLVVDMSSSEPMSTRALAAELKKQSVDMVDAPVSGGVKGARNGALTIMVGGSDDDVARAIPVLEHLGRPTHAGPIASGHAVKALNNLLSATHLWITSEAMIAGKRFGLDPEVMLAIFNGSSGRSGSTENKWPNFILPEKYDSGFGLRLMLKDMKIAVQLAEQSGAPTQLGEDAVALWQQASDGLEPGADHTEIARWLAERK
ncbi:MAG: NAD(P)-dependent oxidoreductase [Actinomycetota bacterium]